MKMTQYMSVFGDNILARTKEVLRVALRQIFRHNKIAASDLDSDKPFPFLSDKLDKRLIQNHQLAFVTRSVHKTVIGRPSETDYDDELEEPSAVVAVVSTSVAVGKRKSEEENNIQDHHEQKPKVKRTK
jgi:hypothetical protein